MNLPRLKFLYQLLGMLLIGLFFQTSVLKAQNFDLGIHYYQQKKYQEAVSELNGIRNAEAYLFTGKSFYAMGRYQQAQANLNNIAADAPAPVYNEAVYTSALIDFQLKEFGDTLSKLHQVFSGDSKTSIGRDAEQLYQQILNYLTAGQRLEAIPKLSSDEIKFDLVHSALGKVTYAEALDLVSAFQSSADQGEWRKKVDDILSGLDSPSHYNIKYGNNNTLEPPDGTVYNIGIALPEYQPKDQEFGIVRSLYFGALIAEEAFNNGNNHARAVLKFLNTGTGNSKLETLTEQFSKNQQGDAIIGPLFSEQTKPMISISNEFKIPVIAPLANSEMHAQDSYLFQSNPTFMMHGRQMARYAVEKLNKHRFAVLADRNSNGAASAKAFIDEAQKLGATIVYEFIEDLRADEYSISQYTQYFGSQSDPVDAIYAPFTGRAALTFIDLLLVDLRVMEQPITVLGSQEWKNINYNSARYNNLPIYFSHEFYRDDTDAARLAKFNRIYRNKFNHDPNQYALIGYDTAAYLLKTLKRTGNPALLKSALLDNALYRGLITNIEFDKTHANKAVKILEVSDQGHLIIKQ